MMRETQERYAMPHPIQYLIDLYNSGLTLRQIGPKINRSHVTVFHRLRKVIKLRPRPAWPVRANTPRARAWMAAQALKLLNAPNLPGVVQFGSIYHADCPKCLKKKKVSAELSNGAWKWHCRSCGEEGVARMVQTGV